MVQQDHLHEEEAQKKEPEESNSKIKMSIQRIPLTKVIKVLLTLASVVCLIYVIKYRHCRTRVDPNTMETRLSDRFTKERLKVAMVMEASKKDSVRSGGGHVRIRKSTLNFHESRERFIQYWNLHRSLRTDYKKILEPCELHMDWKPKYPGKGPYTISSANNSYVTLDIQPAGQYSTIKIDTYSRKGTKKHIGGDSWRIHVQGPASVPVVVTDSNNGSYEASFLLTTAGVYSAEIYLDYTLCDGYKDPPVGWFIKGNSQGKYQPNSALPGNERAFLEDKFNHPLLFDVKEDKNVSMYEYLQDDLKDLYDMPPCFSWDGFGQWISTSQTDAGDMWIPSVQRPFKYKTDLNRTTGRGVFWIYGDSIGDFLYRSISKSPLCSEVFNDCRRTYNWIYNIPNGNIKVASAKNDDKDFDIDRVERELMQVLQDDELDYSSAVLLNYGLHFVQDVPFKSFHELIDRIVATLKKYMSNPNHAKIIWKSTTALQKWKYGNPETNARHNVGIRFLTSQRVELFNALSTSKMCEAGIDVIDVYPMTYSYPNGTGSSKKYWDAVHYEAVVFKALEEYIYDYFNIGNYL